MLAALLCRPGQTVGVSDLIDAMWGEEPPAGARKALHVYVHRLRQDLGSERLRTDPAGYALMAEPGELDVARFAALAAQGRAAYQRQEFEEAGTFLAAATALWRGPAFADVTGGHLVADEARRLDEQRLVVHEEWIAVEFDRGRHVQVIDELTRLTDTHPYREHLRSLLMLALHRAGRQADALELFGRTRTVYVEQLGVEPGLGLQRMHEAVLRADPHLSSVTANAVIAGDPLELAPDGGAGHEPVPRQLPADVPGFTGRADALAALDEGLPGEGEDRTAAGIAVLTGTAGVGKTALAVHWAHRVAHRFPGGQLYVDLCGYAQRAPMTTVDVLAQMLRALGTPPDRVPTDLGEAATLYRSLLAERAVLIVLDNAVSAQQVEPLLPANPECFVLVTSRERLHGLSGRAGAQRLSLDVLGSEEAISLLTWCLGADRVAAERAAVAVLAQLCAHLPLALRIAAANLTQSGSPSVATYAAELAANDPLLGLVVEEGTATAVRASFDLSFHAMPADARRLYRLLGLVPGPDFTVGAAAALAGVAATDVAPLLARLVDVHLLEERAPGRYGFHDLLRQYAVDRARSEEPDPGAALERLLTWYLHTADRAARLVYGDIPRLPPPEDPGPVRPDTFDAPAQAMGWLDAELANLVAAVQHPTAGGSTATSWLLADALQGYFWMRLRAIEWLTVASAGLSAARARGDHLGQAAMLISLGNVYARLGRHADAADRHREAITLARREGWTDGLGFALRSLGLVECLRGRPAAAVGHLSGALAVLRETGRRSGVASCLSNLGNVYWELGRLEKARRCLQKALTIARELDDPVGLAIKLGNLAEVCHSLGLFTGALGHCLEAVRLARETGHWVAEAEFLRVLAAVRRDTGEPAEALEDVRKALARVTATGNQRGEADTLNTLGTICQRLGRYEEAERLHGEALELSGLAEAGYPRTEALIGLALTRAHLGAPDPATASAEEALRLARRAGYRVLEGAALSALAEIELGRGWVDAAAEHALRAVRIAHATGHHATGQHARSVLDKTVALDARPVTVAMGW